MNELMRWNSVDINTNAPSESDWRMHSAFSEPDVLSIFRALVSNLHIIAGVTLIGALIAFAALKSMTPQFTASTMVMLDSRSTILDETSNVFTTLPIADAYIETEIELIRSDAIVRRVIDNLGLLTDPEFAVGAIPPGIRQLAEERGATESPENGAQLLDSVKTLQVAKSLRQRLGVKRRGLSQGIVISFRSRSQVKAQDVANAFAKAYVSDQLQNKLRASRRAMDWLSTELEVMAQETQASERAVETYREKNTLIGEGEQGLSSQQLRLLTGGLAAAKVAKSELSVTLNRVRQFHGDTAALLSTPEIAENATIRTLRTELSEAERAVAEFASRYNIDSIDRIPPFQDAVARRRSIEAALDKEVTAAVAEIEAQFTSATNLVASLEDELNGLRAKNAVVNTASVGLNELEREAEGKRRRYEALLAEFNAADNVAAVQTPHARIVSPAELPLTPSAPRKKAAFSAAVIFSFTLGVFIAMLREHFRRSIRTTEEFQMATNIRAIGVTPALKARNRNVAEAMSSIVHAADGAFSASIRSLRAELALESHYGACKTIAVTAATEDTGKSALAAGLARSMAFAKISTLLIDANLQRPQILPQLYRKRDGADFGDALSGEAPWRDVVARGKSLPLDILGARRPIWDERLYEFFEQRFEKMLGEWRNEYQAIIVNTPPALVSPKARAIARHCDDVVLCVQWNETPRREVLASIDLLGGAIGAMPKAVLINVEQRAFNRMERRDLGPLAAFRLAQSTAG